MLYELIPLRWINLFRLCRQVRNLQISIPSQLRWKWFRIMSRQIQKLIVDNKKTILEVLFRRDSINKFFSPNFEKRWLIWSKKVRFFLQSKQNQKLFLSKINRNTFFHNDENPHKIDDFWRFYGIFVPMHLLFTPLPLENSFQNAKVSTHKKLILGRFRSTFRKSWKSCVSNENRPWQSKQIKTLGHIWKSANLHAYSILRMATWLRFPK